MNKKGYRSFIRRLEGTKDDYFGKAEYRGKMGRGRLRRIANTALENPTMITNLYCGGFFIGSVNLSTEDWVEYLTSGKNERIRYCLEAMARGECGE